MNRIKAIGSLITQNTSILGIVLMAACIAGAISARAYDPKSVGKGGKPEAGVSGLLPQPAQAAAQLPLADLDENTEVELVLLQPHGFEPATITRKPGKFLLVVQNHSGVVSGVSLSFRDSLAQPLQQTTMALQRMNWDLVLDLQAGTYTLAADNNPNWTCSIVVQQ